MTDRAEWLASLKVGDTVGIEWERVTVELGAVTKITPARRITVSDRFTFAADGDQYPRPARHSASYTLHQPDDVFMALLAWRDGERLRVELVDRLRAYNNSNAPKDFDHATHNAALRACLDALGRKP